MVERAPDIRQIKEITLKPMDAWWTVLIIDPIAVRIIWLMERLDVRITPEGITWASLVPGLACGVAFGAGNYIAGAVLYEVSFLLDCLDGKWSRLKRTSSERGAFLDGLVGTLVLAAAVGGLGFHERLRGDAALVVAGAVLLISVRAVSNYLTIYLRAEDNKVHTVFRSEDESWLARHRLLAPMSFPDRHVLLFVIAPFANVVGPMFIAIGMLELGMQLKKWQLAWRQLTLAATSGGEA